MFHPAGGLRQPPISLFHNSCGKVSPLVSFNTIFVIDLATSVINDLPGLPTECAINLKRPIEEQLPATGTSDLVVRLDVIADLGIGDGAILDKRGFNERLTVRYSKRNCAALPNGEHVRVDNELGL